MGIFNEPASERSCQVAKHVPSVRAANLTCKKIHQCINNCRQQRKAMLRRHWLERKFIASEITRGR